MQNKNWLNISIQIIKVFMYGILYCTIFCSGLIIKFMFIFAISQLKEEKSIQFCDYYSSNIIIIFIFIILKYIYNLLYYIYLYNYFLKL